MLPCGACMCDGFARSRSLACHPCAPQLHGRKEYTPHGPWARNGSEPNHCPNNVRISHRALLMFCEPCKQTLPPQAGSSKSASLRAEGSPFRTNCAAMSVPRTNFRAGDRVRGAEWFEEIRGATGTVVEAILVTGQDWAAQDLLVRFDRPVRIFDDEPPTWTFCHSAHNFEFIDESETAPGLLQDLAFARSSPLRPTPPAHQSSR